MLLHGSCLLLSWPKGSGVQSPPASSPVVAVRLWGQCCFLLLSDGIQQCVSTLAWGLLFSRVSYSSEEKVFSKGERKNSELLCFFLKPVRSTSYAGWFSHCVFFLSFGTNTTSLYQKEGCSCLQTWGRGRLPPLSLLYSFVIFVAWFLKISKAYTDKSSVCLPTQLFLDLLANFILIL